MKDGLYDFHFVALDRDRSGHLTIQGNLAEGSDGTHVVRGQLSRAGANILASFDVDWHAWPTRSVTDETPGYTIRMFGTGTTTTFSVIGIGPLGLIVELRGDWRASLPDREDNA